MADRRLIAQSITDSGQVARLIRRCGPWAGIFFSWCIPFIDDDSRLDGDPETLHSIVLGRYVDEVSDADVAEFVATINDLELAVWYEVIDSDERYLYFPKFQVQQGLRADRYVPSRRPAPPGWVADEGHPYLKNPELVKSKPPKDRRRTHRVPKRKPTVATMTTTRQPVGNQLAPEFRPNPTIPVSEPRTNEQQDDTATGDRKPDGGTPKEASATTWQPTAAGSGERLPPSAISVLSGPSSLVLSNPSSLVAERDAAQEDDGSLKRSEGREDAEDDPFPDAPQGADQARREGVRHVSGAATALVAAARARSTA
ncbi:MAG TPA: hypothetical protein VIN37_02880 [Candidatus Limnocylindria bacterium]